MKKTGFRLFSLALALLAWSPALLAQDTLSKTDKFKARMDSLKSTMPSAGSKAAGNASPEEASDGTKNDISIIDAVQTRYSAEELLFKADSLRKIYDFPKAVEFYDLAIRQTSDSLRRISLEEERVQGENGLSMMDYCVRPVVVAKQKFSISDFFLFYPMPDKSWRKKPNQLDSLSDEPFVRATYIPDGAGTLFYSAPETEGGVRNIYQTHFQDTTWSAPELINEQITSLSNEIYPMLSPDGNSLYFASKGLYGAGGYDLYVSTYDKDTHDWGTPVNMGFPISSPYDDFLYYSTDDGKYSIFASNRECSIDSVYLYVLEYDSMPIRSKISNVGELRELASLKVSNVRGRVDNSSMATDKTLLSEDTRRYADKITQIRNLRDSVSAIMSSGADDILTKLPPLQKRLDAATKELQSIEMEFLSKGVVMDPDKLRTEADREIVGASSGYTFTKHEMGQPVNLVIDKAVPKIDHTFKILDVGQFADESAIPEGLIYQIMFVTLSKKAGVEQIKGLSPVFERMNGSRYSYYVGLFRSYKEALSQVNNVKRLGFKSAVIVALRDGKSISVSSARSLEAKTRILYKVKIYATDGQNLSDAALDVIHELTDKDIVKLLENGSTIFEVGPLDDVTTADAIVAKLKSIGTERASVIESGKTIIEK